MIAKENSFHSNRQNYANQESLLYSKSDESEVSDEDRKCKNANFRPHDIPSQCAQYRHSVAGEMRNAFAREHGLHRKTPIKATSMARVTFLSQLCISIAHDDPLGCAGEVENRRIVIVFSAQKKRSEFIIERVVFGLSWCKEV